MVDAIDTGNKSLHSRPPAGIGETQPHGPYSVDRRLQQTKQARMSSGSPETLVVVQGEKSQEKHHATLKAGNGDSPGPSATGNQSVKRQRLNGNTEVPGGKNLSVMVAAYNSRLNSLAPWEGTMKGANANKSDNTQLEFNSAAIRATNNDVERLLNNQHFEPSFHWEQALLSAVKDGHPEIVRTLFNDGRVTKYIDWNKVMLLAAESGVPEIIGMVLEDVAFVPRKEGMKAAFARAVDLGHDKNAVILLRSEEVRNFIIDDFFNLEIQGKQLILEKILTHLIKYGRRRTLEVLLRKSYLARAGHVMEFILENSRESYSWHYSQETPNCRDHEDSLKISEMKDIFLESRRKLSANTSESRKFLWACRHGDVETVRGLLLCGADPSMHGQRALQWAAWKGHKTIVELLLSNPSVKTAADKQWALKMAIRGNHVEVVRQLLARSETKIGGGNNQSIREAIERDNVDMVRILITHRTNVLNRVINSQFLNYFFKQAIHEGRRKVVDFLLDEYQGQISTHFIQSGLIVAAGNQDIAILKRLMAVPAVDPLGQNWRLLFFSANRGYSDCLKAILDHEGVLENIVQHRARANILLQDYASKYTACTRVLVDRIPFDFNQGFGFKFIRWAYQNAPQSILETLVNKVNYESFMSSIKIQRHYFHNKNLAAAHGPEIFLSLYEMLRNFNFTSKEILLLSQLDSVLRLGKEGENLSRWIQNTKGYVHTVLKFKEFMHDKRHGKIYAKYQRNIPKGLGKNKFADLLYEKVAILKIKPQPLANILDSRFPTDVSDKIMAVHYPGFIRV